MRCDAHTALVSRIITIGMMIFGPVGEASAEDCRPIIVKEGYLAQAQFECDFADLSEALTDASRKCGDGISKDAVGEALKEGMEAGPHQEHPRGGVKELTSVCRSKTAMAVEAL
jgi:hypothetical protein